MTTRIIVRVLDAVGLLLGWTEQLAEARGDGALWALTGSSLVPVELAGTPAQLSVHWADVNVEQRAPWSMVPVAVGQVITIDWHGPIFVVGAMPGALPPVTVRAPVRIDVPVGALGARAT